MATVSSPNQDGRVLQENPVVVPLRSLSDQIQQLKAENAALWKRVQDYQRKNGEHIQRLPHEILRMILQYSIPPDYLLDSSFAGGPKSPWCLAMEHKRRIATVCQDWYQVGIDFLYEHVVLRRMAQFEAFLQVLEPGTSRSLKLAGLITKLTLHCYVPHAAISRFNLGLFSIFEACHRVNRVTITLPHVMCKGVKLYWSPNIRHLDLGHDIDIFAIQLRFPSLGENLVSFSFCLPAIPLTLPPTTLLNFPCLDTLRCKAVITSENSPCFLTLVHIEKNWIIPRLQRLHISWDYPIDIKPQVLSRLSQASTSFCKAHGRHLRTLSFHPILPYPKQATACVPDGQDIRRVLASCPVLEHLVLSARPETRLMHAKVKWIDIWSVDVANPDHCGPFKTNFGRKYLPSLVRVRILDYALCTLPAIAMTLSPDLYAADVAFQYEYPGVEIDYANGVLQRMDATKCANATSKAFNRWMGTWDDVEDTDTDGDFSGESSDDAESWSGSSRWSDDTREFPSRLASDDEQWLATWEPF